MKKLNFLPTKVLYDKRNSNIKMWFRLPNKHDLMCTDVPFAHSIFVEKGYSKYGEFSENDIYYYLTNDEIEMFELFISPSEAQDIYKSERYITGEADCSPEQKFITQTFYDTEFPAEIKPRIFFLDIETYSTDGKLPLFNHNIAVINAITLYDTYTKKYYSWFLKHSNVKMSNQECYDKIKNEITDYGEVEIIIFNDAKLLLGSFINFVNKECPDIITAWNLPFDMPYIVRKIIDNFGVNELKKISPFNRISSKVTKALDANLELKIDSLIPGIDSIDYLELYKKNTPGQKPSYRLADIALEELHTETKLVGEDGESDPNIMYINNFIHFCKYNIQDVRIMKLIEEKRKILDLAIIIRNITKTNYQDIFYETALIDNMFLMEAIRRRKNGWKYVLPSKPINAVKVPFVGAYVKAPLKGRFEWVADLDFKSLYPSIVKTFKLSNESVVGIVKNKQVITLYNLAKQFKISDFNYIKEEILPKYLTYDPDLLQVISDNVDIKTLNDNTTVEVEYYYALYANKDFPMVFDTIKQFASWIKENNFVFMPNGVIVDQNREDAIIAKVIADIMKSREDYKKLMLESLAKNDKAKAEMYDTYQTAVKVVNNSCFTEDHSVLTLNGIKNIKDVKIGDKLYSFNTNNKTIEEDFVTNTICKNYNNYIYNINTIIGKVDFSVTDDHKLVLEDSKGSIVTKTAEELYNEYMKLPEHSRKVLYWLPDMYSGNNIISDEKTIFLHEYIINKYTTAELDKTFIYIIPKEDGDLRKVLYYKHLKNIFNHNELTTCSCNFGINRSIYKIPILNVNNNQLNFLKENDGIFFDCYYKKWTNTRNSGITPFSFNSYDLAEFIGWLLSEGCMGYTETKHYPNGVIKGVSKGIGISQYKIVHPEYYDEIYKMFKHMRFTNLRMCKSGIAISNAIFYDWINDLTKHKSNIPDFILNGTDNIKKTCLSSLFKGDGHKYSNEISGLYTTINPVLRDQLLNILLSLGYQTRSITETSEKTNKPGYRISYLKRKIALFRKSFSRQQFNGEVYCLTTNKNHNFFAGKSKTGTFRLTHNCYGVTAKESFRLADVKIADAITTTGQLLIRSSTYIANEKLNELSNTKDQDYVITNDTDSIIFTLRKVVDYPVTIRDPDILAEIAKYSTICQEYVNDSVYDLCKNLFYKHKITKSNNFLMIKNEWLADAGLFVAKKMYAVHKVFKEGIPYDKLVPTGLSLKRSSTPAALKPFIEKVIVNILSFKNKLEIDEIIIEECRKLKEEYNIKDIAIPSSLNDLDKYLNVPIHVRGIKIWNKYFAPSDRDKLTFGKLKYFYVKGWENNKLNLDKEYVLSVPNNDEYWILIKDKVIVDYNRMKERLIFKPINAFYSAMEWEMPASISSTSNNIFLNVKSKSKFKIL